MEKAGPVIVWVLIIAIFFLVRKNKKNAKLNQPQQTTSTVENKWPKWKIAMIAVVVLLGISKINSNNDNTSSMSSSSSQSEKSGKTFSFPGFNRHNISTEMDKSYAAAIDSIECEEYGYGGTWVKCTFHNATRFKVPLSGIDVSCYKGNVKVSERPMYGTIDPGGALEESLVCGGEGITLVKFKLHF